MLIVPLSHENSEVQRIPYVTIGIIVLNIILYIFTYFTVASQKESYEQEKELVSYYYSHPYLDFPEETFEKLSPQGRHYVTVARRSMENQEEDDDTEETDENEEFYENRDAEQEILNARIKVFEKVYKGNFYGKYGYVPSRGGVLTLFSSIFLHGGIMHLLGNMLFLFISGCKIEDLWGRVVYPFFYLLGGVAATYAHAMMCPEKSIPLIGASGAIAALMGAFMIRLYKTKILFFYLFWWGFVIRHGKFNAPAYVVLPLWLVQQIWDALTSDSGGVAFWAHIGGFVFGAVAALVFRFIGLEEKIIAPAIEKKVNLVDDNFTSGVRELEEGDIEKAAESFERAIENDSQNAIARIELSKVYYQMGKKKEAFREFRRAIILYVKHGDMENAADDYLRLSSLFPGKSLEAQLEMKIINAFEERKMYSEAATVCKKLFFHCQQSVETKDGPEAVEALTRYGDICLDCLEQPKTAFRAYRKLLDTCDYLSPEQKGNLESKARNAVKAAQGKAKEAKKQHVKKKAEISVPKPGVPVGKKIRLAKEVRTSGKYELSSVSPREANKVLPVEGGLDLVRPSEKALLFQSIYFICVFELDGNGSTVIYADIFVRGEVRPYRIASNRISYPKFLPGSHFSSLDNFRNFILHIISHTDSVYLDQETMNFLKSKKIAVFSDSTAIELHEKRIWKQLIGEVRFQCETCREIYWVDGRKIPESGAKSKCKKCGAAVFVRKFQLA